MSTAITDSENYLKSVIPSLLEKYEGIQAQVHEILPDKSIIELNESELNEILQVLRHTNFYFELKAEPQASDTAPRSWMDDFTHAMGNPDFEGDCDEPENA